VNVEQSSALTVLAVKSELLGDLDEVGAANESSDGVLAKLLESLSHLRGDILASGSKGSVDVAENVSEPRLPLDMEQGKCKHLLCIADQIWATKNDCACSCCASQVPSLTYRCFIGRDQRFTMYKAQSTVVNLELI
jgi:hypothetical protein